MRKSPRAVLGAELRRDPTRCAPQPWKCGRKRAAAIVVLGFSAAAVAQTPTGVKGELPDAPSALMSQTAAADGQSQLEADGGVKAASAVTPQPLRPCKDSDYVMEKMPLQGPPPCMPENPVSPYVTSAHVQPLSSKQKGLLAYRDFVDPFNLITIVGYSAIAIAANSHSAYGSGMKGVGTLTGYGLAEDGQGELFQTYVIPSLVHEDPRYHRMPSANVERRLWHAVEHTFVSQHDDGRPMPNYATLLTYPISAELSNLYVPGLQRDAKSTCRRVGVGLATDPSGYIVAEFLPDVAKHIHINVTFIQNILNTVAVGSPNTQ